MARDGGNRASITFDGHVQELHNYQAWVIAELLDPIQWARAETTAFPQMMDALAIGAH